MNLLRESRGNELVCVIRLWATSKSEVTGWTILVLQKLSGNWNKNWELQAEKGISDPRGPPYIPFQLSHPLSKYNPTLPNTEARSTDSIKKDNSRIFYYFQEDSISQWDLSRRISNIWTVPFLPNFLFCRGSRTFFMFPEPAPAFSVLLS